MTETATGVSCRLSERRCAVTTISCSLPLSEAVVSRVLVTAPHAADPTKLDKNTAAVPSIRLLDLSSIMSPPPFSILARRLFLVSAPETVKERCARALVRSDDCRQFRLGRLVRRGRSVSESDSSGGRLQLPEFDWPRRVSR